MPICAHALSYLWLQIKSFQYIPINHMTHHDASRQWHMFAEDQCWPKPPPHTAKWWLYYIVDSDLRNNNLRIDQISNLQVFFSRLLLAKTYGQRVFLKECPKFFILTTCSYLSRESITATMRCHICQVSRLLYHSCKDASSRIAWKSIWACPVLPRQGFLSLWGLWLQALCLSRFFLMKDVAFNEKAATIY